MLSSCAGELVPKRGRGSGRCACLPGIKSAGESETTHAATIGNSWPVEEYEGGDEHEGIDAEVTIGLSNVVALRKVGGFGWKGRLLVGWATGREVVDGLEVVDRWGKRRVITAIRGRDELFNRVVSIGAQSWECL